MTEKTFVKQLEKNFNTEGFLTKKELNIGYGVADLVLVKKDKFNTKHCKLRKNYNQFTRLLKEDYFKIFKHLPNEDSGHAPVNLDYLIEKTHLSKSFLKYNILRTLEQKGYIKKENGHFYFKINGWMPIAKEVIAVEAKMRNWKRGFVQANRYRVFADRVYLALPIEVVHLVDKRLLKKHNVGLIVFDAQLNRKKIALLSRRAEPLSESKKNLAMEFFWGRQILRQLALL